MAWHAMPCLKHASKAQKDNTPLMCCSLATKTRVQHPHYKQSTTSPGQQDAQGLMVVHHSHHQPKRTDKLAAAPQQTSWSCDETYTQCLLVYHQISTGHLVHDHSRNRPCAMMHGVRKATRCTKKSGVTKGPWKSRAPPRSCTKLVMQVTNMIPSVQCCVSSASWLHFHSVNTVIQLLPAIWSCLADM